MLSAFLSFECSVQELAPDRRLEYQLDLVTILIQKEERAGAQLTMTARWTSTKLMTVSTSRLPAIGLYSRCDRDIHPVPEGVVAEEDLNFVGKRCNTPNNGTANFQLRFKCV